jgi:two-component system, NarL family, invasion response regulator UvrY
MGYFLPDGQHMKNILIADDHSLIRSGLRMVLEKMAFKTDISEAWDAKTVMTRLKEKPCDLILLDIQMPATDSVVLMHWIQSFYPNTKILIVSQNPESTYGKRYMLLGANGFISKTAPDDEMIQAIDKVLNGGTYVSAELSQAIVQGVFSGASGNPFDQLSQREFQVVICLAKGYPMNEICEMLQVQYSTAHTHKRRAFEKLNIEDNKGLAQLAGAYDLLS